MKKLTVDLPGRAYDILIEDGLLDAAGDRIKSACPKAQRAFVVTDKNVAVPYLDRLLASLRSAGFDADAQVIPAGEPSKCVRELSLLWENMMNFGLTRTDVVVALGGGVVGDLAGFAAATILRGVDFVQIPTTLLAQVDSSVGGKVAIDLCHGKNLAGAFWQPRLVLMDPRTLDTLPDDQFSCGMAEVIKYGCIYDAEFFRFLQAHPSRAGVMESIEHVLYTCCDLKRQVVLADERDTGARMALNFGHTLGHAYELAGKYETWNHGQAVAAGMVAAVRIGAALGVTPAEAEGPLSGLCAAFGLPLAIDCSMGDYTAAIGLDKKSAGRDITLVLLEDIGKVVLRRMDRAAVLEQVRAVLGK